MPRLLQEFPLGSGCLKTVQVLEEQRAVCRRTRHITWYWRRRLGTAHRPLDGQAACAAICGQQGHFADWVDRACSSGRQLWQKGSRLGAFAEASHQLREEQSLAEGISQRRLNSSDERAVACIGFLR